MLLEDINFCARCGHAVERRVLHGALRPFCPQCRRVHFLDPKVAVGVLIQKDGQLLLIQRRNAPEQGKWSIPAGFVDKGEDPAQAAAREVLEETNLIVTITQLVSVIAKRGPAEGADILIVYKAEVTSGVLQAGDDAAAVGYFGPANWPPLAFPSTEQVTTEWQAAIQRI